MKKTFYTLICCLLLLPALQVMAQTESNAATQQDLYLQAMQMISEGRQSEADETLSRMLEQEPQHAGAWLDLAIIQCELGHTAEAERLFTVIETRFAPPPGIMEVIKSHRLSGCKGWQPHNKVSVLLGRGYDNNVNQGASDPLFSLGSGDLLRVVTLLPEFLPQADHYTLLSTQYIRDISADGSIAYAQLQARENDSLTQYNTISLLTGIDKVWHYGDWGVRTAGNIGFLSLGDQLYQREAQLQARFFPPVHLPEHVQWNLLTGLSYVQYTTLTNENAATDELGTQLAYQDKKTQAQLNLSMLFDHGDAERLGGDRKGWLASALINSRLNDHVSAEFGMTAQNWTSQSSYAPGLIDQIRQQNTEIVRAGLIFPIAENESLHLEWRKIRNNENISLFQYTGQLFQISLQWKNF